MKIRNKSWLRNALILTVIILLSACHTYTRPQKGSPAISDMNESLQAAYIIDKNIAQKQHKHSPYLNANLAHDSLGKADKNEQRFDIAANDIPAKDFFMGLVKDTSYNMVVSPKIEGVVTLNLKQVTIPEVLQAAKDNYGYQFKRTLYGYEVHPASLETRTFTVNYLDMSRHGKSTMSVSSGQITQKKSSNASAGGGASSGGTGSDVTKDVTAVSSVETTSKSDFWKQLLDTVKAIVGDKAGREVVINPASGMIFVRAYPDELDMVGKYLDSMQETMTRQVIIEAKVMEVILNDEYQAGINWKALGVQQNGLQAFASTAGLPDLTAPDAATATAAGGIFTIAAKSQNAFSTLISLLSTQGNVQVLSSPRIATLNNQKAVIKVGQDNFFITNVVNTTVTGTSTQNSQNVELTPFFSGISLDVTPEIDQNDKVILHIHPMISTVTTQNMQYTIGGASSNGGNNTSTLPLAQSSIRESDNIVSAENGQIVVIGGLMTNTTQENTASTPGLSKAPIIGSLFRRTHQVSQKAELVILLRPIVVGKNTWAKEAQDADLRMRNVNRGFHYGTAPEIFGNKAEQDIKTR
ncbi:MSHA biogenesis protein MshL [Gammaproteobacteria bacterium]